MLGVRSNMTQIFQTQLATVRSFVSRLI